ncbi:hypothetical protein QO012_004573, partial [Methylobacterium aerolatum]|nr:hypothetical protein [Methylobacterium aerolatum]
MSSSHGFEGWRWLVSPWQQIIEVPLRMAL